MWELDYKESWVLKNWCFWTVLLEKTLESPLDCKEIKPVNPTGNQPWNIHWKDWCWSWSSNTLATWCKEPTHWKRPWYWEKLRAGGEGDNRGWAHWMASLTQKTGVWASSRREWRTGKPGVLQSMGLKRVGRDWATEQQQMCSAKPWERRMDIQSVSLPQVPANLPGWLQTVMADGPFCCRSGSCLGPVSWELERVCRLDVWTVRLPSQGSYPGAKMEKGVWAEQTNWLACQLQKDNRSLQRVRNPAVESHSPFQQAGHAKSPAVTPVRHWCEQSFLLKQDYPGWLGIRWDGAAPAWSQTRLNLTLSRTLGNIKDAKAQRATAGSWQYNGKRGTRKSIKRRITNSKSCQFAHVVALIIMGVSHTPPYGDV